MHDCEYSKEPLCPQCGLEYDEVDLDGSGIETCECGFKFIWHSNCEVTYSTECVEHCFGEWQEYHQCLARFCTRCGKCQLQPPEPKESPNG